MTNNIIDQRDLGTIIPSYLDDWGLSPNEFRVYCRIARRAGSGKCFESVKGISKGCVLSVRTVGKCIASLLGMHLIERERPKGAYPSSVDTYYLTHASKWKSPERKDRKGSEERVCKSDVPPTGEFITQEGSANHAEGSANHAEGSANHADIRNPFKESTLRKQDPPMVPPPERGDIAGRKEERSKNSARNTQEDPSNSSNEQIHTEEVRAPLKAQINVNDATLNVELGVTISEALDNELVVEDTQELATQGREAQNDVIEAEIVEPEIIQDCSSTISTHGELLVIEQHVQPGTNVARAAQTNQPGFVSLGGKKELKSGRTYFDWEGRVSKPRGGTRMGVNPEFVGYVIKRNAHIKYFQEIKGSELIRATEGWLSKRPEESSWLWDDFLSGEEVENKTIKQVQQEAKRNEAMERMDSWITDAD